MILDRARLPDRSSVAPRSARALLAALVLAGTSRSTKDDAAVLVLWIEHIDPS